MHTSNSQHRLPTSGPAAARPGVWRAGHACVLVAGLLLAAGAWVHGFQMRPDGDAERLMALVREAQVHLSYSIDDPEGGRWRGSDVEVPYEAIEMLRPNVLVSRLYRHEIEGVPTGAWLHLMFVHTRDARSMIAHYPPICYRMSGWDIARSSQQDWTPGDGLVEGMEYDLVISAFDRYELRSISNTMLIPREGFARDMAAVERIGRDAARRYSGAGQIQVIFDATRTPAEERQRLTRLVLEEGAELWQQVHQLEGARPPASSDASYTGPSPAF